MNEPKVVETKYRRISKYSIVPPDLTPNELIQYVKKGSKKVWVRDMDRARRRSIVESCHDENPRFRPTAALRRAIRDSIPPGFLDRPLVPLLNVAWVKGVRTCGSCAGHSDGEHTPSISLHGRASDVLRVVARLRAVLPLRRIVLGCRPDGASYAASLTWGDYGPRHYSKSEIAALDALALRAATWIERGPSVRIPANLARSDKFLRRTLAKLRPVGRPRLLRAELRERLPDSARGSKKRERWLAHLELARLWRVNVSARTMGALRRAVKDWERAPRRPTIPPAEDSHSAQPRRT